MAKFFRVPFADLGEKVEVPIVTQPDGSMSFEQGFGPNFELDYANPSSLDIPRKQTNQFNYDLTSAIGEIQQYGFPVWTISGKPYPLGATVRYNDTVMQSTIGNNNNEPNGAGWVVLRQELLSTTGNSTVKAMTQKAVTDEFNLVGTEAEFVASLT